MRNSHFFAQAPIHPSISCVISICQIKRNSNFPEHDARRRAALSVATCPLPLPPLIYEHEPLSSTSLLRLMKYYFLAWLRSNSVAELQKTAYGSILLPWLPTIFPLLCSSKMPEICRGLSEWGRGGGRSDGAGAGEVSFWRALFDKRSSFFLSMFGAAGSMASGSGIGQH